MIKFSEMLFKLLSNVIATDQSLSLNDHEVMTEETEHSTEMPHECGFCSGYFFDSFHECPKLNEVAKANYCSYNDCGKRFSTSSDLRKHQVSIKNIIYFHHSESNLF